MRYGVSDASVRAASVCVRFYAVIRRAVERFIIWRCAFAAFSRQTK